MMTSKTCIIVGGGHAAARLVTALREQQWDGEIILLCEEQSLPYHRPPLSKDYLLGGKTLPDLYINAPELYDDPGVTVRLHSRVVRIHPQHRQVVLEGGERLHYDKLVLATGARARRLAVPGTSLPGVYYLRTVEDAEAIRSHARPGGRAVVLGGGYIGLETAAALRKLGMEVTVAEAFDRILRRVATETVSGFFERVHREEGVEFLKNVVVERLDGRERIEAVVFDQGRVVPADLVVIGIGVIPDTFLAEKAELQVDNGVLVDQYSRTSDPDILAIGDCTSHHSLFYDRKVRLESVQNAMDQAVCAAHTLTGSFKPYEQLPWFWSTQFDVKLQIAGLNADFDQEIVRGDLQNGRQASVFYLRANRIIAVYAMNAAPDFALGKRLIEQRTVVDPVALADPQIPLRQLLG